MNRVRLTQYFFFISQYLYFFASCQTLIPLILTEKDGKFEFTKPKNYDYDTHTTYFKTPDKGITYRFCPYSKFDPRYLIETGKLQRNKDISDIEIPCTEPIQALLFKVQNSEKLLSQKKVGNYQELELYHAGFMLYNNFIKRMAKKFSFQRTKPDYGKPRSEHKSLIQIEFYYNKIINQTIAAQYKLLAVNYLFIRNMDIHQFHNVFKEKRLTPIPPLFTLVDSPSYLELFQGKITKEWMQILSAQSERNPLSLLEFASCEHFALSTWMISCRFNLNYIPLWKLAKLMWLRVEIFARIVAQHLDDLQVTAGVTGTMTLSNNEVIDINGYKMPKYFWKIFEYVKDEKVYGIIVVLNCNIFEKSEEKICGSVINCQRNGWMIQNDDYRKGEIYCCEMTTGNIEKLYVNFLSLKKREVLNLMNWIVDIADMRDEYEKIISRKVYQIDFE